MKNISMFLFVVWSVGTTISNLFASTYISKITMEDSCGDGIQNGDETGVDCGGLFCDPCATFGDYKVRNVMTHKKIASLESYTDLNTSLSNSGKRAIISLYNSGNGNKKVFVMSTDGSYFKEIFDYANWRIGCPCRPPFVDISDDGQKILWTDGEEEIFVADFNGNNRKIVAEEVKNKVDVLANFQIDIRSTPKFNADASSIYFLHAADGEENIGLWEVGISQKLVTNQLFSYKDFDDDFSITYWSGVPNNFAGIHVSENNEILFLTSLLDASEYDTDVFMYKNGNYWLIDADGPEYGSENNFALSKDGKKAVWYKEVYESVIVLKTIETNSTSYIDLGDNFTSYSYPAFFSLNQDGSLIHAKSWNGGDNSDVIINYKQNLFYPTNFREHTNTFTYIRNSILSPNFENLIYVTEQDVWNTDLTPPILLPIEFPSIHSLKMKPNWVINNDWNSTTEFRVDVIAGVHEPITEVNFVEESFDRGPYSYLGDGGFYATLHNDGTHGDEAVDSRFTNDEIYEKAYHSVDAPLLFDVRFNLFSDSRITSYNVFPFYITNFPLVDVKELSENSNKINVSPTVSDGNFTITLNNDFSTKANAKVINSQGQFIKVILDNKTIQPNSSINVNINELESGIYFILIDIDNEIFARKIIKY